MCVDIIAMSNKCGFLTIFGYLLVKVLEFRQRSTHMVIFKTQAAPNFKFTIKYVKFSCIVIY